MAWPVQSGPSSSGPLLPVVPLPWAERESRRPLLVLIPSARNSRCRQASIRKAKYGAAMFAGLVVVSLTKKMINSIPVVNVFTKSILDLIPTILIGPALGAALVYGVEQGDMLAARHVVREKAQRARQELDVIVQDVKSEVQASSYDFSRQLEKSQAALEGVARVVVGSVEELERAVIPVAEREYRRLEAHVRQAFPEDDNSPFRRAVAGHR